MTAKHSNREGEPMIATGVDTSVVYIVDDDVDHCQSLEWLIESVGLRSRWFTSANEFLQNIEPETAGCLLLDLRMPGMSGIELQDRLRRQGADMPIILVTGYADVPVAVRAMKEGAFDVIEKPFSQQELLDRIHDALSKNAAGRHEEQERRTVQRRMATLSEGEREVLTQLCQGKSNKEIAASLRLTRRAIEARRAKIMRKMQADSLAQLIRMAMSLDAEEPV
jgi:two-component system, LuxR family, response regulator FixJ